MKTYMVETSGQEVLGYYFTLKEAKECLFNLDKAVTDKAKITLLVGPYRCEGYYKYYLIYEKGKFKRLKGRLGK